MKKLKSKYGEIVSDPSGIINPMAVKSLKRMISSFNNEITRLSIVENETLKDLIGLYLATLESYKNLIDEIENDE